MIDLANRCILVSPPAEFATRERLFQGLEQLYPVRFVSSDSAAAGSDACVAELRLEVEDVGQTGPQTGRPVFAAPAARGRPSDPTKGLVDFSDDSQLVALLRRRSLMDEAAAIQPGATCREDDAVLARLAGNPVWIKRRLAGGVIDWVASPLPVPGPDQQLAHWLNRSRLIPLLPLLHWLDEVTAGWGWVRPVPRAAFMFDDPNQWARTYGFVDYRALALHADQHGYHASMATIPIDVGRIDPRALEIFRDNPRKLSLLVHGNDHTHQELAQNYPDGRRDALVRQALRRIERLERLTRLPVAKVMAAPHGACNEPMARALATHGFESACISRGSLAAHNPQARWPAAFGLQLAEVLGGSLPVFPRFRLAGNCEADVVLAAFLGQAIIPVGHHQDVRQGLGILAEVARLINGFGPVAWGDLAAISRANFLHRRAGKVLVVRPHARVVELVVPEFVEDLQIELPWSAPTDMSEVISVVTMASTMPLQPVAGGQRRYAVSGRAGQRLRLSVQSTARDTGDVREDRFRPWAYTRRFLAESRDRIQPLLPSR